MSDIDEKIGAALDADDREFLASLEGERGVFRQLRDSFHGPMKGYVILANILVVAVSLLGVYAIWGFLNADETVSLLRWAALGWAAWTVQIALKQWMWDRMNMQSLLREVKRLELQVTMLGEKKSG